MSTIKAYYENVTRHAISKAKKILSVLMLRIKTSVLLQQPGVIWLNISKLFFWLCNPKTTKQSTNLFSKLGLTALYNVSSFPGILSSAVSDHRWFRNCHWVDAYRPRTVSNLKTVISVALLEENGSIIILMSNMVKSRHNQEYKWYDSEHITVKMKVLCKNFASHLMAVRMPNFYSLLQRKLQKAL